MESTNLNTTPPARHKTYPELLANQGVDSASDAAAAVDDVRSVLILRPQSTPRAETKCKRALVDDPAEAELLGVSLSERPAAWYDGWCDVLGAEPDSAAVVTTPELATGDAPAGVEVKTVATPSNLTGVGVKTTPYLSRWEDPTAVIESLTVLLQYADQQEAYQFLHVLETQVRQSGGEMQVYADPIAEDDRTLELLKIIFDGVVEYEDATDGGAEWAVQRRTG